MKKITIIISVLLLMSCNKEYFPEKDAFLDPKLIGTWSYINVKEDYPVLQVFTKEGYTGRIDFVENYSKEKSLIVIYYNEHKDNVSLIYERSRFKWGRFKSEVEYYVSDNSDTLFYKREYDDNGKYDTLIKYDYQLIFDGPEYIGIDSIK